MVHNIRLTGCDRGRIIYTFLVYLVRWHLTMAWFALTVECKKVLFSKLQWNVLVFYKLNWTWSGLRYRTLSRDEITIITTAPPHVTEITPTHTDSDAPCLTSSSLKNIKCDSWYMWLSFANYRFIYMYLQYWSGINTPMDEHTWIKKWGIYLSNSQ